MEPKINIPRVTDPEARRFLGSFLRDRAINREYYELVPEDKFDYRMVNSPKRKSDSPRESLAHQIGVERDYVYGIATGTLRFESGDDPELKKLSKSKLLELLSESDRTLIDTLATPGIMSRSVTVPWSPQPVPMVAVIWALDSHEIMHQGWNMAVMDHLDIPRFESLKQLWGS